MTRSHLLLAPAAAVALAAAASAQPASRSAPKITLAHDTTRITRPLKPDGTPDYLAALRADYGKGVTRDNNAAIPIVQAIGPGFFDDDVRAASLKALGLQLPAKGKYVTSAMTDIPHEVVDAALDGPWTRADHPEVVKWLDANAGPLELVVAASGRSRYYVQPVKVKPGGPLQVFVVPSFGMLRIVSQGLHMRACLAIGEGRVDDAWRDVVAVHRLGVLLGQDASLVGQLVGMGIVGLAGDGTITLATRGGLTVEQARAIVKDLRGLGPVSSTTDLIDGPVRYFALERLIAARNGPGKAFANIREGYDVMRSLMVADAPPIEAPQGLGALAAQADWNAILRRANVYFDTVLAAMARKTFAQRRQAYGRIDARLRALRALAVNPERDRPPPGESGATRRTGTVFLAIMLSSFSRVGEIRDAASAQRDLALVAVALAGHKADKGAYPRALGDLAPAYLKQVPDDFCSGRPFIYKRRGKGYLLYSVGMNMRDDGGVLDRDKDKDDRAARADQ